MSSSPTGTFVYDLEKHDSGGELVVRGMLSRFLRGPDLLGKVEICNLSREPIVPCRLQFLVSGAKQTLVSVSQAQTRT